MFSVKKVLLLALAGMAIAAPAPKTVVKTVTVYVDQNGNVLDKGNFNIPSGKDSKSKGDDKDDTPVADATPVASGSGSDTGYMAIVNKYRQAGGLSTFTQSSKLEANAGKTAREGNGQMEHQLNSGTMGQVLAPGDPSDFEHVYVGGWLCERPSLKGLNGICSSMTKGWSHGGQTGHADILTDSKYTQIGCACEGGIWACDVA